MKKFLLAAICMLLVGFSSRATAVGDVNGDGRVNVSDVTALINIILGIG